MSSFERLASVAQQISIPSARFAIGDVVRHRIFDFRGVVFDVDPEFANSDEWYDAIPESIRPSIIRKSHRCSTASKAAATSSGASTGTRAAQLTLQRACHRRLAFPSAAVSWTSVRVHGKRKFVGREPMFAVVRTGGKQYRVAPGDKIVVEKLDGNAGDRITLGDILLAGDGSDLKKTDGLTVAAEIVAQAKADKVTVFKKRRRQNYRRKKGHRQQHTILKIVAIGDHKHVPGKAEGAEKPAKKAEAAPAKAPKAEASPVAEAQQTPAATAKSRAKATAAEHEGLAVAGTPTESPAPTNEKAAGAEKAAPKKAAPAKAKSASTKNAAPAKGAAKKSPKAK
jgi:large subunit ribosomal protein L21